jgi:WD40 repeat protein
VSGGGGEPEALTTLDTEREESGHVWPSIVPGRDAVVFVISAGEGGPRVFSSLASGQLAVLDLTSGNVTRLGLEGVSPRYVQTGHLVYAVEDGSVRAVPFDVASLTVTGGPVPLVESVSVKTSGAANFSVSSTGALVYVPGGDMSSGAGNNLAILGLQGGLERLTLPQKAYAYPRISPDGTRVAVSTEDAAGVADVWIYDLAGATAPRQLTLGGANRYPVWSADGERVAFQSDREGDRGIFWQKADGSGTAERLTTPETGSAHTPDSWSPDGKTLSYTATSDAGPSIWLLSVQDREATVFAEQAGSVIAGAAFSPDGQWLAYYSNETGAYQIVVQPVPSTGAKYLVGGGGQPSWSPDGRELFFYFGGEIRVVRITPRPTFSFGEPTTLPLSGLVHRTPGPRAWDITHDGQGILGVVDAAGADAASGTSDAPQIQVVLNWIEELKRRVPTD